MSRPAVVAASIVAALLLALAAWQWWPQPAPEPAPPAPMAVTSSPPPVSPPVAAPAEASAASAPEPQASAAPLAAAGIGPAMAGLLGAQAAARVETDEFARRFVATVDNLARGHAPALMWPTSPSPGRFTVMAHQGRTVVSPDNARRYQPFVQWLEAVDDVRAVALYARLLPLLQQAYENLGFPRQRFHARLLAVIDHLLAAPEAPEWIEVRLTEVKGPIPSLRPWVRYEFADPALQSASAGHKLMVRVGASNQRRLKLKLQALRAELVRQAGGG